MRRTPQSACTFRFHQVDVCPFRGYPPQATRATFVSSLLCPAHLACRPLAFPASGTQAPGRRFSPSAVLVAYASACMCARNVSVTPPSSLWVSPSLAPLKVVNCTRAAFKEVLSVAQSADPAATTTTILAPVGLNLSARDVIYLPSRHRLEMTSLQVQIRPVVLTVTDVFLYTVERVMAAGTACPQGASRCKATSGTSQTAESSVLALDMETELQQSVESALTVSTAPLSVLLHTASVSEVRLEVSYDRSVDPPADYSLPRRVPMLALLPSLYHARIVLGNRTFKNVGGASVAKTMAPVVESYLDELLSQLPSTIRSVGLFRGASVLQSAASKIASLFSGSGTTGIPRLLPPDGSALL